MNLRRLRRVVARPVVRLGVGTSSARARTTAAAAAASPIAPAVAIIVGLVVVVGGRPFISAAAFAVQAPRWHRWHRAVVRPEAASEIRGAKVSHGSVAHFCEGHVRHSVATVHEHRSSTPELEHAGLCALGQGQIGVLCSQAQPDMGGAAIVLPRRERDASEMRERAEKDDTSEDLKSGVFWFVVYRKTSPRHVESCEMDSAFGP